MSNVKYLGLEISNIEISNVKYLGHGDIKYPGLGDMTYILELPLLFRENINTGKMV